MVEIAPLCAILEKTRNKMTPVLSVKRRTYMPEEEIPFQTHLELIHRELLKCMEDIEDMRTKESNKKAVKGRCQLLKAALGNARHYLREFEESLGLP